MTKKTDVLRIVKEDILRILAEQKKNVSLDTINTQIKVSSSYIFKVLNEIEQKNLIKREGDFIILTRKGEEKAKNILKKHFVLENFFMTTANEQEAHRKAHIIEHYVTKENLKNIKELSTLKEQEIPLSKSDLLQESIIADINIQDNKLFERLVSMGLFLGEKIKLFSITSDNMIINVGSKKFALDKKIAENIMILRHDRGEEKHEKP